MTRPHPSLGPGFLRGDERTKRAAKPSKVKMPLGRDPDRSKRAQEWLDENREALDSWNAWVEEHGLPLAKYRLF